MIDPDDFVKQSLSVSLVVSIGKLGGTELLPSWLLSENPILESSFIEDSFVERIDCDKLLFECRQAEGDDDNVGLFSLLSLIDKIDEDTDVNTLDVDDC